ncbi:putative histone acetyltransferase chromatin regulator PHD family [Medicago truncatula]|uniref:Putative histone acetyltransferase chromatin regulator PHD family n=1 Tax=Medicago truncatula TaxID=3880 RepID=A0A396I4S4_MEDTR|nr:putative histone acetyltransferase chromatin regulator PHD family [Medicago truncatula]
MTNFNDSELFVIKSKVRTGHKREFSFALNSYSEIGTSLSKTRPRKNQNMVPVSNPKKTGMSSSKEELKDNVVVETVAKNGDYAEKKMKNKTDKKKNKKPSIRGKRQKFCVDYRGLFSSSCEESKNRQPSPRHTIETIDSRVSPTTVNHRSPEPVVPQTSSYKGMKCNTYCDKSPRRITRKDRGLHKLVFQENMLEDGAAVGYFDRGKKLLHGKININKSGILCGCCNEVVSPSKFEAHAGRASRRKPYSYIRTADGVSLHELANNRRISMSDSDERCSHCEQVGNLLWCDRCQRSFHLECIPLESPPKRKRYCEYCRNKFHKDKNVKHKENDVATGRIAEGDPSEQITEVCTLSEKQKEVKDGPCALCSERDFNNNESGPRTVMICKQCEKEFHVECLKDHNMANLVELPKDKWFCGIDCDDIHMKLQKLMARGEAELGLDIKWRLLNTKLNNPKHNISPLISKANAIFHVSIVVSVKVIACAGIFRVLGQEVAELPLVATTTKYQKRGYFRSLFSCIENMLRHLKVKTLVLPAAHEAESMWIDKFGFTKPNDKEMNNFRRFYPNIMIFDGSLLQKHLSPPLEECSAKPPI